jgi:hypothetical protein
VHTVNPNGTLDLREILGLAVSPLFSAQQVVCTMTALMVRNRLAKGSNTKHTIFIYNPRILSMHRPSLVPPLSPMRESGFLPLLSYHVYLNDRDFGLDRYGLGPVALGPSFLPFVNTPINPLKINIQTHDDIPGNPPSAFLSHNSTFFTLTSSPSPSAFSCGTAYV